MAARGKAPSCCRHHNGPRSSQAEKMAEDLLAAPAMKTKEVARKGKVGGLWRSASQQTSWILP
jgi:muconolactone delta-isomerase